jgi:transcriptional regulator with XRE-family HTH domain
MITARQSRAARALLGWTQETLADKARTSLTALKRLESESGLEVYETTRDQVSASSLAPARTEVMRNTHHLDPPSLFPSLIQLGIVPHA